ncbi:hypothetical protein Sango_1863200 [Sesamum angolense]|uniref:Uncharacterized protein n=1 Tax=Sesamum angolense TaxID=2727404 RepID=A0AAE1WIE7_9LAMI|nr:hypothetical protein Sango_1863200 [Sesamum angolense]
MVVSRNISEHESLGLASIFGLQLVPKHDKYLGLLTIIGKSRAELFQSIKDGVWNRIHGWNAKLLSQAEREVLIKAVLQAIPMYIMSCFQLPDYFLRDIERMISDFWWHNKRERHTHWVGGKRLCLSKDEGGMGFREMIAFNRAMLTKQGWRLLTRPDSLFTQVLKAKYFPRKSFFRAEVGPRPSLTWRSIVSAKELLKIGCRWRIGSGQSVRIWGNNWLPKQKGFKVTSAPRVLGPNPTVSAC